MFFAVSCRCGHSGFGRQTYFIVTFALEAASAVEAAQKVRWQPRCQHHKKDAILAVNRISKAEADEIKWFNKNDPFLSVYLSVHNIQEQRRLLPIDVLLDHLHEESGQKETHDELQPSVWMFSGKSRIRHPNKFFKYHRDELWLSRKAAGY